MISSDKNIETITQLIDAIKDWLGVRAELLKIDAADKGVRILTALIFIVFSFFFGIVISIFLSLALALFIGEYTGMLWAFVIMAVAYLLVFLLLFIFRKILCLNPLMNLMAALLKS